MKSFTQYLNLSEANEITFAELSSKDMDSVQKFLKLFKAHPAQPVTLYDGIHGRILYFQAGMFRIANPRFDPDFLKKLLRLPMRWFEVQPGGWVTIGF